MVTGPSNAPGGAPPAWLDGRQRWLAGAAGVVFVLAVAATLVADDGSTTLDSEAVKTCAAETAAAIELGSDITVTVETIPDGTGAAPRWSAVVISSRGLLRVTYGPDGRVLDGVVGDGGGFASPDPATRQRIFEHSCEPS